MAENFPYDQSPATDAIRFCADENMNALRNEILQSPSELLMSRARALRHEGHGRIQSYSPKIFIPLTKLCRDYCHYCTFSRPADRHEPAYLTPEQVLDIARRGAAAGCTEALFTIGDKPELRHAQARDWLANMGYASTTAYLAEMCTLVLRETGLLPHVNAGVMGRDEMAMLRTGSASQGLMLESISDRLCKPGGPHHRSPDKDPAIRLGMLEQAGELAIPFTTGILIGIGETREERLDALFAIRDINRRYGHIQEVIIQNFRAKPRTPMAEFPEPDFDDLLWTIAAARMILGPTANIQAPPNLSDAEFPRLMDAGINDWGGISPVTPDHVNPESPWPDLDLLARATREKGGELVPRLPLYPAMVHDLDHWADAGVRPAVRRSSDAEGWARGDRWHAGSSLIAPNIAIVQKSGPGDPRVAEAIDALAGGAEPDIRLVEALFSARGYDVDRVCYAADRLRAATSGDAVGYVVNRNINYTNICSYACGFCAFSKGDARSGLRGRAYDLDHEEIARRVKEAAARGASEVCLQGGIHPAYTGETYLSILRTVKHAVPDIHVHAFSPLEVTHGAQSLNMSVRDYLLLLQEEGLGSLPGTAAEILDDDVRAIICPDKLTTEQWLHVVETAHDIGLLTTATIMFGHVDNPAHWARHLLAIRALQARTGGFTEFVPLPFVHMEAPIGRKGLARMGPTFREVRLMHAVARLVLHPLITNIQASWTKLGQKGVAYCLDAGANDLGGTLMNESISRAAGSAHGQEFAPDDMETLIHAVGRVPRPRTTLYQSAHPERLALARSADPLKPVIQTAPVKRVKDAAAMATTHREMKHVS